jgi:hypothetical protein
MNNHWAYELDKYIKVSGPDVQYKVVRFEVEPYNNLHVLIGGADKTMRWKEKCTSLEQGKQIVDKCIKEWQEKKQSS